MDTILKKAALLAEEIKQSGLCREFMESAARLSADAPAAKALEGYERLLESYGPREGLSFEQERHLGNVYWELTLNETIKDYLVKKAALAEFLKAFYGLFGGAFNDIGL